MLYLRASLYIFIVTLTACVVTMPVRTTVERESMWLAKQTALGEIRHWDLQGRLSLTIDNENWMATLYWLRQLDRDRIDLTGPFGQGRIRLEINPTGAVLKDHNQKTYRGSNAQALLSRVIGKPLPIDHLRYWLVGLPAPIAAHQDQLDNEGRLASIKQSGWQVNYLSYNDNKPVNLPKKMKISRYLKSNNSSDTSIVIKLVISRWQLTALQ